MTWRGQGSISGLVSKTTTALAVLAALGGAAWGQVALSGANSHSAAKPSDTGFSAMVNSTGGFGATVPLDIPPAKRGLPVPVSVIYGGRTVGAGGMGWDIPLSYIVRDTSYAHRLPWYDDTVTRGTTVPRGVEQLTLVLEGRPMLLMRSGDPQASTTWVPVHDGPQLEVHDDAAHGTMLLYDGDGRTYTFLNAGPVGAPGQAPTAGVPLLGGTLYTLASITAPGSKVLLEYTNTAYPLSAGGAGLAINLSKISYNSPTSAGSCYKNQVILSYDAPAGTAPPYTGTMINGGMLMRVDTVTSIDVMASDGCAAATVKRLRRHSFTYDVDPDTGMPRLTSVAMSGREQTPEELKQISLGHFAYGTASTSLGVLRYDLRQTMSMPSGAVPVTAEIGLTGPVGKGTDRGTWHQLIDMTGDGLPDLVYQTPPDGFGNTMAIATNGTSATGTQFVLPSPLPSTVAGAPDKPLQRETTTNIPQDLDPTYPGRIGRDMDVWRQEIDVNGDGRVDLIDAHEVEGQWVVYLNTPGPVGPSDIRWRRTPIDVGQLSAVLAAHGYALDGVWVPLSRRHIGTENRMDMCYKCTAAGGCTANDPSWQLVPSDSATCAASSGGAIGEIRDVLQSTYVEWEVRDVNGDGYVDVVFNDVGGVTEANVQIPPNTGEQKDAQHWGRQNHVVMLPSAGIDAVLNLAGPLLSGGEGGLSLYPFSAPVQIWSADHRVTVSNLTFSPPVVASEPSRVGPDDSNNIVATYDPRPCGVGYWAGAQAEGTISSAAPRRRDIVVQYCGFADVNGDGLVDRIERTTATLQGGDGTFGVATVQLPSFMQGHIDSTRYDCCNDPNSPCTGRDPRISPAIDSRPLVGGASVVDEVYGFKDLNGDGILDYIYYDYDSSSGEFTVPFAQLGTGLGYGARLAIQLSDFGFNVSQEEVECPNRYMPVGLTETLGGLYDLDGDGKAEMVFVDGQVFALTDGASDWGRPAAGRLTSIDNGHGALTRITYRSAKEGFGGHQVPFPEIVATKVETVKTSDQTPLAVTTLYAFGQAEMVFDSLLKRWQFGGYRRVITMQVDGSTTGRMTVADSYGLQPMTRGQSQFDRFLAYGKVGRAKDLTLLAGAMSDPWDELIVLDLADAPDSRTIGATHYDYDLQMASEREDSTVAFCREMVDPYDYVISQQNASIWPVCATHGFTFESTITTWRGTAAPPAASSVQTVTQVSRDELGRVTSQIYSGDGEATLELGIGYATPVVAAGSNAPRILNAVSHQIAFPMLVQIDAEETWQYDGDDPDSPSGTVSDGFPTTHTVTRLRTDGGGAVGKVRTTFAWDTGGGALSSVLTAREDSDGNADGASRTVSFSHYDDFNLAPLQTQIDSVSAARAAPIPSLKTTVQRDPFNAVVQSSIDENGTLQGVYRDGFDRPYETFTGPNVGPLKVTSTTSYTGFASDEAGPPQITTRSFVDLDGLPGSNTPGVSSTTYLDELGRSSYTATQLGTDYGNQTLITDARVYDLWGRTVFAADPHVSSQDLATTYGTSSYFQVDGMPDCTIRGPAGPTGPHELARTADEMNEVYPTCFTRTFVSNREQIDTREPDSLLTGSPQFGVIHTVVRGAEGRVLNQSTSQGGQRLEYADFSYDSLGQLSRMQRYGDAVTTTFVNWTWDSLGQLIELHEPMTAARLRSYSSWGELVEESWTDANTSPLTVHRVNHTYDALGRVVHSEESQQSGTDDPVVDPESINDYFYDSAAPLVGETVNFTPTNLYGRLARAVSPAQTVTLSYDELGRLNGQAFGDNQLYVETRSYHNDGTLGQLHLFLPDHLDESGHSVDEYATYSYDSMRRLNGVSYADGSTSESLFSGTRDVFGRVIQGQYDATALTATYAPGGRRLLTDWKIADSAQSHSREISLLPSAFPATYDPVGRERERKEVVDGRSFPATGAQYSYDALGQLSTWTNILGVSHVRSFHYDQLGNLLNIVNEDLAQRPADVTLTYDLNDLDRVAQIAYGTAAPQPVTYDAVGGITQMPTATGATRTIDYFNSGAVRSVSDDAGNTAQFKYDAFGGVALLQVDSTSEGNTRHDRHYGATIGARDEIVGGTLQSVVTRSIPGDDGILAMRHGPTSTWTFAFGEQRATRFFTDRNASFLQDENYTAFGAPTSDPPAEKRLASYSSDMWNGGDTLEGLGITELGARLYDPAIGRFLSRDPVIVPRTASTTNPYAFASNDPINASDRSGLSPLADYFPELRASAERERAWDDSYEFGVALGQVSISPNAISNPDQFMLGDHHLNTAAVAAGAEDWRIYRDDREWRETNHFATVSFDEYQEISARVKKQQYLFDHPGGGRLEGIGTLLTLLPVEGLAIGIAERVAVTGVERATVTALERAVVRGTEEGVAVSERLAAGSRSSSSITVNKAAGDEWSRAVGDRLKATHEVAVPEITVKTPSGVRTRLDWATRNGGKIGCHECKASATARLTGNQAKAFPEIERAGAVVVGKGKPGFPGGTVIPPTKVDIIRP